MFSMRNDDFLLWRPFLIHMSHEKWPHTKNLFLHLRGDPKVFAFSCYIYTERGRERERKRERRETHKHTDGRERASERERERERFTSVTRVPALSPAFSVLIISLPLRATLTCLPRQQQQQQQLSQQHRGLVSS